MKKTLVIFMTGLLAIGAVACKPKTESAATDSANTQAVGNDIVAEYQKFADDYIAAYKKMKAGDMSGVQAFQALGQKAQDWAKKTQDNYASLTPAQQKKLQEISENLQKTLQAQ